jgi:hypothetical protein
MLYSRHEDYIACIHPNMHRHSFRNSNIMISNTREHSVTIISTKYWLHPDVARTLFCEYFMRWDPWCILLILSLKPPAVFLVDIQPLAIPLTTSAGVAVKWSVEAYRSCKVWYFCQRSTDENVLTLLRQPPQDVYVVTCSPTPT